MNTTFKFDEVILVKELNGKFKQIGEVFEVADVLDGAFLLRNVRTNDVVGVISFDDFDKHFVHKSNFKGWTKWTQLSGFDGHSDAFYRTNQKKVQVKFLTDNVRAEACCCKDNDFNLDFGVRLAYRRCLNKARTKQRLELEEKLNMVKYEIAQNETIMKKMVNSLEA